MKKKKDTVLVLRTCTEDMSSHSGFVWPRSGPVSCPDWDPSPKCGHGLHGFAMGQGDGSLAGWSDSAQWLVVEVLAEDLVDLGGKVKFRKGTVLYAGDRKTATDMIYAEYGTVPVIGGTVIAGYRGTATAGDSGTANAGYYGTATTGDYGTATAGDYGTATAGDRGTANAGYYGTATVGYHGTATAGDAGTATAGDYGIIQIGYHDGQRYRILTGYVGEDGIQADTAYQVRGGEFVLASAPQSVTV